MSYIAAGLNEPTESTPAAAITIATYPSPEEYTARWANYNAMCEDTAGSRITLGRPDNAAVARGTALFTDLLQQASGGFHLNGSTSIPVFGSLAGLSAKLILEGAAEEDIVVRNNSVLVHSRTGMIVPVEEQRMIVNRSFKRRFQEIRFVGFSLGQYDGSGHAQDTSGVAAIVSGRFTITNDGDSDLHAGQYIRWKFPEWDPSDRMLQMNRPGGVNIEKQRAFGRPKVEVFRFKPLSQLMVAMSKPVLAYPTPIHLPVPFVNLSVRHGHNLLGAKDEIGKPFVIPDRTIMAAADGWVTKLSTERINVLLSLFSRVYPRNLKFFIDFTGVVGALRDHNVSITGKLRTEGFDLDDIGKAKGVAAYLGTQGTNITATRGTALKAIVTEHVLRSFTDAATILAYFEQGLGVTLTTKDINDNLTKTIANAFPRQDVPVTPEFMDTGCACVAWALEAYMTIHTYAFNVLNLLSGEEDDTVDALLDSLQKSVGGLLVPIGNLSKMMFRDAASGTPYNSAILASSTSSFMGLVESTTGTGGWLFAEDMFTRFVGNGKTIAKALVKSKFYDYFVTLNTPRPPVEDKDNIFLAPPFMPVDDDRPTRYIPTDVGREAGAVKSNDEQLIAIFAVWSAFAISISGVTTSEKAENYLQTPADTPFMQHYGSKLDLTRKSSLRQELLSEGAEAIASLIVWYDEKAAAMNATTAQDLKDTDQSLKVAIAKIAKLEKDIDTLKTITVPKAPQAADAAQIKLMEEATRQMKRDFADLETKMELANRELTLAGEELAEASKSTTKVQQLTDRIQDIKNEVDDANVTIGRHNTYADIMILKLADALREADGYLAKNDIELALTTFLEKTAAPHDFACLKCIRGGSPGSPIDVIFV